METGAILYCAGFEYSGPIDRCCDAGKGEKDAANKLKDFSSQMVDQASSVFGNDSTVFNQMMKAYSGIIAGGPSQHGFSQAELNAKNSQAITNNANQYRNIAGAVKSGQAAYGGGNSVSGAGVTTAANLGIAEAAAGNTANELSNITQQDYDAGRSNFWNASQSEQSLPGVFNNLPGVDNAALGSQDANLKEQKSLDSAKNWWQKPVMGLVSAGLNIASGGVSGLAGNALDAGSDLTSNMAG